MSERFLGVDGGGTSLRVVIVRPDMIPVATLALGGCNPNVIGLDAARERIRAGVGQALGQASLEPSRIAAAGIGVAGASREHSRDWLIETLKPVLRASAIAPSSDLEIALVGALEKRHGILLLAGTGSAAYGCAPGGRRLQVGGWGYLLGDAGSSYWIGSRLLKRIARETDAGRDEASPLARACLEELGLASPRDLIAWLYRGETAPIPRIAALAPLVMRMAEGGDSQAQQLLDEAAGHLVEAAEILRRRLDYPEAEIAFAGGLLDHDNWLSREVARRLQLPERPRAIHEPVVGAALLAKLTWSANQP